MNQSKIVRLISSMRRYRNKIGWRNVLRLIWLDYYATPGKVYEFDMSKLFSKKFSICLRAKTSDSKVFSTVFLRRQYPAYKEYEPDVIIDAGANIGLATLFFKYHYPNAKIIAIEPDDENCALFDRNTAELKDVYLLRGGVWPDKNNTLTIRNPGAAAYSYQLEISEHGVKAWTIPDVMQKFDLSHIDFLKMDIEGGEREMFSNNFEWLEDIDNLMVEVHDHYAPGASQALLRAIGPRGFHFAFCGENVIFSKKMHKWIS
jgi:FkbM family methyltransferase